MQSCFLKIKGSQSHAAICEILHDEILIRDYYITYKLQTNSTAVEVKNSDEFTTYYDQLQRLRIEIPKTQSLPLSRFQTTPYIEISYNPQGIECYKNIQHITDPFQIAK